MATINKSKSRFRAKSASSVPSHILPSVNGNLRSNKSLKSISITGRNALTSSLQKSIDFPTIENEYIKNLQQQIYFLELECDYLREEVKKAESIPNSLSLDAERMARQLKLMRSEIQLKEQDILQKDSTINVLQHDNETLASKLENVEEIFSNEKKELINEIVCLKKRVERHELDSTRKGTASEKVRKEFDNTLVSLKESDNKVNILQAQLSEKGDAFNKLRLQFEEARAECLKARTEYQELEERFFNSKAKSIEEVDLKAELKNLRYELREKEIQADHDRTLRLKISEDCTTLVKENAALSSQVIESTKQLDRERDFKQDKSLRKQANIQELVTLKEERKHSRRELERTTELLYLEKEKYRKLLDKYSSEEENHTRAKLSRSKLKAELEELEGLESAESAENMKLRRDHVLLADAVNELQGKLREREDQVEELKIRLSDLQVSHADLDAKHRRHSNLDSIKWEEFERMADQMKHFSRTMSPARTTNGTALKSRLADLESE